MAAVAFLADGTYIHVDAVGFERGFYAWAGNAAGGAWTVTTLPDTNAGGGLSGSNGDSRREVTISGDTYLQFDNNCSCSGLSFTRHTNAAGAIVGGWVVGNPALPDGTQLVVLLGDGTIGKYVLADDGPGLDFVEVGTYAWDSNTHVMVTTPASGSPETLTATLTRDELGLVVVIDQGAGGTFTINFARIVDPGTVVPVFTGTSTAAATTGVPFSFIVETRYAATTTATNLPPGLDINTATGEITGTPTARGVYNVQLSATNSFGLNANAALTITVKSDQAALSVDAPPTAVFGTSFPAAATGGSGTGALTFLVSGVCSYDAGAAQITMTSGTGSCFIAAEMAGDSEYNPATSQTVIVTAVKALQSSLSVTNAPATAIYNQSFTVGAAGGTTGGGVAFAASGSCGNSGGGAVVTMTAGTGACSITATMAGNDDYEPVSSAAAAVAAGPATSTTTLIGAPASSSPGQAVTFTATVTPQFGGAATGTVAFRRGGTVLGTAAVSGGIAELVLTTLGVGSHSVSAIYGGDSNVTTSTSSAVTVTVVAPSASTITTLVSSLNPSYVGQLVTLTATVTSTAAGTPTGTVTFKQGPTAVATVALSGGQATYSTDALPQGNTGFTAIYSGDSAFITSTSASLTQQVDQGSTTIVLTSGPNPATPGSLVTFTATLTSSIGAVPTGTVSFKKGGTTIGTAPIDASGVATLTTSLSVGRHNIRAQYDGDASNGKSTSNVVAQVVR